VCVSTALTCPCSPTPPPARSTLSLHDALPISMAKDVRDCAVILDAITSHDRKDSTSVKREGGDFISALINDVKGMKIGIPKDYLDRKSTRLNSSHVSISYAVFCLKKKTKKDEA